MITSIDFNLEIRGALPITVPSGTYILVDIDGVAMFPLMSLSKLFNIDHKTLLRLVESDKIPHKPLRDVINIGEIWQIEYFLNPIQVANLVKEVAMGHGEANQISIYDDLTDKLMGILQALKQLPTNM